MMSFLQFLDAPNGRGETYAVTVKKITPPRAFDAYLKEGRWKPKDKPTLPANRKSKTS